MNTVGTAKGKFSSIVLQPLPRPEVQQLVAKYLGKPTKEVDEMIYHDVYNHSFGVPSMAMSILKKKYEMCDELYHLMADDLDHTVVTATSANSAGLKVCTTRAATQGNIHIFASLYLTIASLFVVFPGK